MTTPDDKILDRVAKILAQANHPNTSAEERDAFLAKADEMMVKHAIDEAMLRATQTPEERRKPIRKDVELFNSNDVYGQKMKAILREICRTARVKVAFRSSSNVTTLVGFADDVSYVEMLFMNVQFAFLSKMRPSWDDNATLEQNVYNMKEAGIKWEQIARAAMRAGYDVQWPDGGKINRAYKRHCKAIGVEPTRHTQRHEAYRHTYAESFITRINMRLETMREAGQEQASGSGSELVLAKSFEEVSEAFYEEFPNLRPKSREEMEAEAAAWREERRLEQEKHAAWLASLTERERLAYEKKVREQEEKDARANRAYWRAQDKRDAARYDSQGARAGRMAADSVRLTIDPEVGRENRKEIG